MVQAKSLFARHIEDFAAAVGKSGLPGEQVAIIYAACIIVEAIRNEQDDLEFKVIQPKEPTAA